MHHKSEVKFCGLAQQRELLVVMIRGNGRWRRGPTPDRPDWILKGGCVRRRRLMKKGVDEADDMSLTRWIQGGRGWLEVEREVMIAPLAWFG